MAILVSIVCWKYNPVTFCWWCDVLHRCLIMMHPQSCFRYRICRIWGFHSNGYEEFCLLGCNAL
jgi:hypothetical protein